MPQRPENPKPEAPTSPESLVANLEASGTPKLGVTFFGTLLREAHGSLQVGLQLWELFLYPVTLVGALIALLRTN